VSTVGHQRECVARLDRGPMIRRRPARCCSRGLQIRVVRYRASMSAMMDAPIFERRRMRSSAILVACVAYEQVRRKLS
jgi:hypothetical protein